MSEIERESKREKEIYISREIHIEKTTFQYNFIKTEPERYLNMKIEEERERQTESV